MRTPVKKSYHISIDQYTLLFQCCERYYKHLAWKYPLECEDGLGCYDISLEKFNLDLKYLIPELFRDEYDCASVPKKHNSIWDSKSKTDAYDQYALLDYIEFFAFYCRDYREENYHQFFKHYHLRFASSSRCFKSFQKDINNIFDSTGLLYFLNDDKRIERVVDDSVLTTELEQAVLSIQEAGTKELMREAISYFRQPHSKAREEAVEKIWDALERLKTYYTGISKKDSINRIINSMANGKEEYIKLFDKEFKELTDIGNDYRIRHHETSKIDISDTRYYEYFFNRCLSLIALAVQYLS